MLAASLAISLWSIGVGGEACVHRKSTQQVQHVQGAETQTLKYNPSLGSYLATSKPCFFRLRDSFACPGVDYNILKDI